MFCRGNLRRNVAGGFVVGGFSGRWRLLVEAVREPTKATGINIQAEDDHKIALSALPWPVLVFCLLFANFQRAQAPWDLEYRHFAGSIPRISMF
jgi:hypothetical protein